MQVSACDAWFGLVFSVGIEIDRSIGLSSFWTEQVGKLCDDFGGLIPLGQVDFIRHPGQFTQGKWPWIYSDSGRESEDDGPVSELVFIAFEMMASSFFISSSIAVSNSPSLIAFLIR